MHGAARDATPAFRNEKGQAFKVREISKILKDLMEGIGHGRQGFSSHGLRIGGATALYATGTDPLIIMTLGRWSSDCYRTYIKGDRNLAMIMTAKIGSTELTPEDEPFMELDLFDMGSDYES